MAGKSQGVRLGVQLHAAGAQGAGQGHLLRQRVHEQAHAHAPGAALGDERGQALAGGGVGQVKAVVAGELVFGIGHEGGLLRARGFDVGHEVLQRVAFDVEFTPRPLAQQGGKLAHVMSADVAAVGPGVDGDAVRARLQAKQGGAGDGRDAQMARVAHEGDLVDIDGKPGVHSDSGSAGKGAEDEESGESAAAALCSCCSSAIICRVRKLRPQW